MKKLVIEVWFITVFTEAVVLAIFFVNYRLVKTRVLPSAAKADRQTPFMNSFVQLP